MNEYRQTSPSHNSFCAETFFKSLLLRTKMEPFGSYFCAGGFEPERRDTADIVRRGDQWSPKGLQPVKVLRAGHARPYATGFTHRCRGDYQSPEGLQKMLAFCFASVL